MITMQPAIKNGRNVWDRINMPGEEFASRIEQVRASMRQRGIDLLLVYSRGLNNYADAAYLTNFIIRLPRGTLVALPLQGEPLIFFEGGSRGIPSLQITISGGELKAAMATLAKDSGKYLREQKLIPATVGLVGLRNQMPYQQFRTLMAGLEGCTFVEADDLIGELRSIKSEREVGEIRRAARIVGQLVAFLKEDDFGRADERMVEALLFKEARMEGAEDVRLLVAQPADTNPAFRPLNDLPLRRGVRYIFFIAAEYERYWAEAIRTFVFDGTSFVEDAEDLPGPFQALVDTAKRGTKINGLVRKARGMMGQKGADAIAPYGIGGGIGLARDERPALDESADGALREGMVLSLRVARPRKDGTFAMTGDTVLVGARGGAVLTVEPVRPATE